MNRTFLVTGGAGFIGSHIVDALVAEGEKVTVVDIKSVQEACNIQHQLEKVNYLQGDISDEVFMNTVCKGQQYIIHLAAIVSVPLSIKDPIGTHNTNVNGTLTVFNAARLSGVKRVVYASSAAVYGDTSSSLVSENDDLNCLSPYAVHKRTNEIYAQYYSESGQFETIGLRYFNVFGLRQDSNSGYSGIISLLRKHILAGTVIKIFGDGEQTRDFVSVKDVVAANLLAIDQGVSGDIYNIATGQETSLNSLIFKIEASAGKKLLTESLASREGDVKHSCASIEKAKNDLSYSPKHSIGGELSELISS